VSFASAAAGLFGALAQTPPENQGEAIVVTVGMQTLTGWTSLKLSTAIDTYAALEITCPWDPTNAQHRAVFVPFGYQDLAVTVGGQTVFQGTALSIVPTVDPSTRTLTISAYARCGKLADCSVPPSAWVPSYEGQTLEQIAEALAGALDVELDYRASVTFRPPEAKLELDGKPWEFLAGLAKQAGCLLTSGPSGELVIWQAETIGLPVAALVEGQRPLMGISMEQSPQDYYSEITGVVPADSGKRRSKKRAGVPNKGAKLTQENPLWDNRGTGGDRSLSFAVEDAEADDPEAATVAKIGRMIAGAVSWSVTVPTWRDQYGFLWVPNSLVTVEAPSAMVYRETTLLIASVELARTATEETATLSLVLPEAFSGALPEAPFPWQ